jgi:hypothetical protein
LKRLILLLILAGLIYLARDWWAFVAARPGDLKGEPYQAATQRKPFSMGAYQVRPLAEYQIKARVYSRKSYIGEEDGDILSQDLALGWGALSTDTFARQVSVSQYDRWTISEASSPLATLFSSFCMSNVHIASATPAIESFIASLEPGDFVSLSGCLIAFTNQKGKTRTSSLSRTDVGEGACEIFYVEQASRIQPDGTAPGTAAIARSSTAPLIAAAPPPQAGAVQRARTATPPPPQEYVLPHTLLVSLPHGSLTIPARDKILILSQSGNRAKISYQGFVTWVDTQSLDGHFRE